MTILVKVIFLSAYYVLGTQSRHPAIFPEAKSLQTNLLEAGAYRGEPFPHITIQATNPALQILDHALGEVTLQK